MNTVYDQDRILIPDAPQEFEDHVSDTHFVPAPCQMACPVGTDAPSYIAYIWEGRYEKAIEAITATNPFSSICGRVCDAPCEPACRRSDSDGPIQIRNLKRFVMDELGADYRPPESPLTRSQTVGIIGAGPAGLTAAHELCRAGFGVHVYEMTDRLGGMMVWGIPAFRLPRGVIEQDIQRLRKRCPGLTVHLNTALGREVSLDDLKERHDAVLLTIGAWWGKAMGIPGEDHDLVVDGATFLRRVNAGERPSLPKTVVVVGGGDVAMDACRAALRLPGCEAVKVVYRRGPGEIPARKIELEGAIKEGIEIIYFTQQMAVESTGSELVLKCIRTRPGEPDADGRCRPEPVPGSEHDIDCGMVIAAVGQESANEELRNAGLMAADRIATDWARMRTEDPKVFAAGDGAFGGSTIVTAMHQGQRAAYYVKHFLEGDDDPMTYRTPYRTSRVPVAQDLMWEKWDAHQPSFLGVGDDPVSFPEVENTYDVDTAHKESARCYRCDAETGSADYSVGHREDLFSMARTNPDEHGKLKAMLHKRLRPRGNPYPEHRAPSLDDVVLLPANLSRLVIDPYREACSVRTSLGSGLDLEHPFIATGFDRVEKEVRDSVAEGCKRSGTPYLGVDSIGPGTIWLQLALSSAQRPAGGAGYIRCLGGRFESVDLVRQFEGQVIGLAVSSAEALREALPFALEHGHDLVVLDTTGALGEAWPELNHQPDFSLLRDSIEVLRGLNMEEMVDIVFFGGVRSGTDAAKLIGLGAKSLCLGVPLGIAAGGEIHEGMLTFNSGYAREDRVSGVENLIRASIGEASMMARCCGKTNLLNVEPEDLRAVTLATSKECGLPLAGARG